MNNVIKYYRKRIYGRWCSYPTDHLQRVALKELTEKQSLSDEHIRCLKDLGFIFEEVTEPTKE
jgi:hypothetical protein